MRDYIEFETTPYGESCTQVLRKGTDYEKMVKEGEIFIEQLKRQFPPPPGCSLKLRAMPHDFGAYYEVRAYFDTEDETGSKWAYHLEENIPEKWDDEAKKELAEWEASRKDKA